MPRPRFKRLDSNKRDVILDAAEREFAAHGFARASYNRVIEQASVSKGAMYYYFDDKADLYVTVLRRAFEGVFAIISNVEPAADASGFWRTCDSMMDRIGEHLARDPARAQTLRGLMQSLGEAPPHVREALTDARGPARRVIEAGQRTGAIRDDLPADMLTTMVLGLGETMDAWIATHWKALRPADFGQQRHQLLDMVRRLCAPAANSQPIAAV